MSQLGHPHRSNFWSNLLSTWSEDDEQLLLRMLRETSLTQREVAQKLGRTEAAVSTRLTIIRKRSRRGNRTDSDSTTPPALSRLGNSGAANRIPAFRLPTLSSSAPLSIDGNFRQSSGLKHRRPHEVDRILAFSGSRCQCRWSLGHAERLQPQLAGLDLRPPFRLLLLAAVPQRRAHRIRLGMAAAAVAAGAPDSSRIAAADSFRPAPPHSSGTRTER